MKLRIITSRDEGTPGAVRFGPDDDPERYRAGNYQQFWWEVANLDTADPMAAISHAGRLKEYEEEAADSKPSRQTFHDRRVEEHRDYIACLRAAAPLAAHRFDILAESQVVIEFFGGPTQYRPVEAHLAARTAKKG